MKTLFISEEALQDMEEIWSYIATDNVEAADQLTESINAKYLTLLNYPFLGSSREDLRASLRSLAIGQYVIFYVVREEIIEIVRIFHGARDFGAAFERRNPR